MQRLQGGVEVAVREAPEEQAAERARERCEPEEQAPSGPGGGREQRAGGEGEGAEHDRRRREQHEFRSLAALAPGPLRGGAHANRSPARGG